MDVHLKKKKSAGDLEATRVLIILFEKWGKLSMWDANRSTDD